NIPHGTRGTIVEIPVLGEVVTQLVHGTPLETRDLTPVERAHDLTRVAVAALHQFHHRVHHGRCYSLGIQQAKPVYTLTLSDGSLRTQHVQRARKHACLCKYARELREDSRVAIARYFLQLPPPAEANFEQVMQ